MEFRKTQAHADGEGGIVIQTTQDVSSIVESNKKQFNATEKHTKWSGEPLQNKIASIPLTVIDDLNHKGVMLGFEVVDKKKFLAFLNHPDNRFFRTRAGTI